MNPKKEAVTGLEVRGEQAIEAVVGVELDQEVETEAFMNELVLVEIHDTTDENAPPHAIINVNGTNQPLARNVPTWVRRKYVEILARCKETKYTQRSDPREPDRVEMVPKTALSYPFHVLEDKNPKGRAWLAAVLAEPA